MEAIDEYLPLSTRDLAIYLLRLLSSIAILLIKQPNSLIFYFLILAVYYFTMNLYISSSRNLKRYESTTRSPVYSRVAETITGVSTIRAYNKIEEFESDLRSKIDINNRCYWYYQTGNHWLDFYLDLISSLILLIVTVQFISNKDRTTAGDGKLIV